MEREILDVPTTTISEVKKSPSAIFRRAEEDNAPVYVFNRGEVAGVMLTRKQYEQIVENAEDLYDQNLDLIVAQRLAKSNIETFTDEEVRGAVAKADSQIDEDDGWE